MRLVGPSECAFPIWPSLLHPCHQSPLPFHVSEDESCGLLYCISLEVKHLHAKHHTRTSAFTPTLKFASDTVFEASETLHMCAQVGVGTQFLPPTALQTPYARESRASMAHTSQLRFSHVAHHVRAHLHVVMRHEHRRVPPQPHV
jgi:hypothetical protein